MIDILDKSFDIFIICVGISVIIFTTIFSLNISNDIIEEQCVKFYKENKYITNSCEIYRDKLESINE